MSRHFCLASIIFMLSVCGFSPGNAAPAVGAVGAVRAVAATTPATSAATTEAKATTTIALNWKAEPQFGGFFAAEVSGAFKKQNLAVTIQAGGAGTPVIQMLAAGKVDFGIVSADELVMSRANGSDVVAVFAVFQTNPQAVMVHEERGFARWQDVFTNSGTLEWQKGLPYAQFLLQQLKLQKLETSVALAPYLGGIGGFLADSKVSQQSFITSEPIAAEHAGKKVKSFLIADAGFNPYTTVLATRESLVRKNHAMVKNMVAAVRSGWMEYLKDPKIANSVMEKLNPSMDARTFSASAAAQKKLIETPETIRSGLGIMTNMRWAELTHQLKSLGLTRDEPQADRMFFIL